MKIDLINITTGDYVYKDCLTSMGASSTGLKQVTNIIHKYDEDTGAKYNVIVIDSDWTYDARTGKAFNGSPMFYIEPVEQPEFSL